MTLPLLPLLLADVPPVLRQALAQEGVPAAECAGGTGQFVLFDSRRSPCPALRPDQTAIDVAEFCCHGEDPFARLADERSSLYRWLIGGLVVKEEVARVDKREVRRRLMARLRDAIERAGGIWLRLSAYPHPYRTAFNLRIDYDEYEAADFAATLDAVRGFEDATSHYVCGAAYDGRVDALARLRGLDVGTHGYYHHAYYHAEDNRNNIARCIAVLREAGIEPRGFVAPHGRFPPGLLPALETLGISHSSEFGLAFDELPFWPAAGRSMHGVLQVPVHPVSLGAMLEAAQSSRHTPCAVATLPQEADCSAQVGDVAAEYFRQVADDNHAAGEPTFFYGHPTRRLGRHPRVLAAMLEAATCTGVWRTTLTEFARWWRARAHARVTVHRDGNQLIVDTTQPPVRHRLVLEVWRGEQAAAVPLSETTMRFDPAVLPYESRAWCPALPRPERVPWRTRARGGLRSAVKRYLDWEKATPPGELHVRDWRGLVKKALRYARP